jgi:hypothetical protein
MGVQVWRLQLLVFWQPPALLLWPLCPVTGALQLLPPWRSILHASKYWAAVYTSVVILTQAVQVHAPRWLPAAACYSR